MHLSRIKLSFRVPRGVLRVATATFVLSTALVASEAAARPYIVVRDDGTLGKKINGVAEPSEAVMKAYEAAGAKRPDVISVWSSFTMNESEYSTLYLPLGNEVTGIGLDAIYGDDGTFFTELAPTYAILLHNNIFELPKRAALQHAPVEGFSDLVFLLELSHFWGPAARVPLTDGGTKDDLLGFRFHWSFWMDAGGSPAGGNRWKDNGNGTFTTLPQTPSDVTFSMLDLYLMGMADPAEVPPFGLLEDAVPPSDVKDPFTNKALSASSFPHWDSTPVTVTATRRTITIEDVIAANGPRVPARKDAPQSLDVGIVLMVPKNASDDDIAKAKAAMDPIAARIAPAFERATRGRGHLKIVTNSPDDLPEAADAGTSDPPATSQASPETNAGGCATTGTSAPAAGTTLGIVASVLMWMRRRQQRRAGTGIEPRRGRST